MIWYLNNRCSENNKTLCGRAVSLEWVKVPSIIMTTFNTSRMIEASVEVVFGAFADGERLARWWGPNGFTNTFGTFEFEPGGRWSNTMHSPNGGSPQNESIFEAIETPSASGGKFGKIVIRHISQPLYRLTVELSPTPSGTHVSWSQKFDDPEVARRIEKIVVAANEQNLDRLTAEILSVSNVV